MKTNILKGLLLTLSIIILKININGQEISSFTFDASPLTEASYGPDAISINPAAATDGEGVYMTTSGNTVGIDLVLPGYIFDVSSIALVFDYIRKENEVVFFRRDGLILSMNSGRVRVQFQTYNGAGTGTNSFDFPDVYTIPNNVRFNFGFSYDQATGIAALYNNGVQVWSNDGANNRSLRFFGGNAYIGEIMDGVGSTSATLFGFSSFNVPNVTLPVNLLSFAGKASENNIKIEWATSSEQNNDYFEIEHSVDGKKWEKIGSVKGNGNTNYNSSYNLIHDFPVNGNNYYRLIQVDFNGKFEIFKPITVNYSTSGVYESELNIYPNPVSGEIVNIALNGNLGGNIKIYSSEGVLLKEFVDVDNNLTISKNSLNYKGQAYISYVGLNGISKTKSIVIL